MQPRRDGNANRTSLGTGMSRQNIILFNIHLIMKIMETAPSMGLTGYRDYRIKTCTHIKRGQNFDCVTILDFSPCIIANALIGDCLFRMNVGLCHVKYENICLLE